MLICIKKTGGFVAKDKNKAFTVIELLVAMGLLVILMGLSSVVFSTTVRSHRMAMATIEITRKLNAITNQLNADFRGLRNDAPMMVWFDSRPSGSAEERFDMIHFFADGDFQTAGQYNYDSDGDGLPDGDKTVAGNIARVFYGHANSVLVDLTAVPPVLPDFDSSQVQVLSRKSHILTADNEIFSIYREIPLISNDPATPYVIDYSRFAVNFGGPDENLLEFNTISLTNWINALNYLDPGNAFNPDNADAFINFCMDDNYRPYVNVTDSSTLHLLMLQDIGSFRVQWAYTNDDLRDVTNANAIPSPPLFSGVRWWPSVDPAGDGSDRSDFDPMVMNTSTLGVYFELPNGTNAVTDWFDISGCRTINNTTFFDGDFYPRALRFTFTLHDSRGIFPNGRTFTHIVYLDN